MRTQSCFQSFRRIRRCLTFGMVAILTVCTPVGAADSLYTARVEVSDRSAAEQSRAMQRALQVVLLKVTGDRDTARRAASSTAFRRPGDFVQQYRYISDRKAGSEPALWFEARFDRQAVDNGLRGEGLQLWGQERPSVLVWLAVQESGRRYLVAGDQGEEVGEALQQAAQQRGLPLLFPLHDAQDQSQISFADVWGAFQPQIMAASARYQASSVLSGRLERRSGNYWRGSWSLEFGGKRSHWDTDGRTPSEAVGLAIDQVADRMARQLAIRASSSSEDDTSVSLIVEGVNSLADYARTLRYLQSLTAVRQVAVREIAGDRVDFSLDLQGSKQSLDRAVDVGRVLRAISEQPQRVYQLVP